VQAFKQKGFDMKTMIIKALTCVAVSLFAITTMAQAPTGVTSGTEPGRKGVAYTENLMATVTAVDKATRDVTLKGPLGNEITVTAGPDVKIDAINVGDGVNVSYKQAWILELKKGGSMVVGRSESQGALKMNSGETVPGTLGRRVTIVADVVGVDPATQTVTLKGPKRTVDVVFADPEQFKRVAKGDQIEATYIQAVAATLEPVKK
jgi:hypothetical protein